MVSSLCFLQVLLASRAEIALSSPSSLGCFFLDTNIILSEILKQNTPRIEQLKKDASFYNVPCFVSDSVVEEIDDKIQEASRFLGDVVRITIRGHLLEARKKRNIPFTAPMTSFDIKSLEELFSYYYDFLQKTKFGLLSPVSLVEEWVIPFLGDMLNQGLAVTIDNFQTQLVKKLLELTSSIESLYEHLIIFERGFVKKQNISLNSRIVSSINNLGIHKPDCAHIASAIIHQGVTKQKTAFVTLDFSSILNKKKLMKRTLGITCCDPLYALHHLV